MMISKEQKKKKKEQRQRTLKVTLWNNCIFETLQQTILD